jgi:hypothetical protein
VSGIQNLDHALVGNEVRVAKALVMAVGRRLSCNQRNANGQADRCRQQSDQRRTHSILDIAASTSWRRHRRREDGFCFAKLSSETMTEREILVLIAYRRNTILLNVSDLRPKRTIFEQRDATFTARA